MERITNQTLAERLHHLNRRYVLAGVDRAVFTEALNGHVTLSEFRPSDPFVRRTIAVGTKRQVADFVHAMTVGIDLLQVA